MQMTHIIMEGSRRQLFTLKALINIFPNSCVLQVNYSKSMIVPINIPLDKLDYLANTFGCSKGSLPFTNQVLPLGINKLEVEDFLPLVTKCKCRLVSTSNFLSQASCLEITNSVFTTLPTFYLCTFRMHATVLEQVDKYKKHCL
jgi:hypothetical protein